MGGGIESIDNLEQGLCQKDQTIRTILVWGLERLTGGVSRASFNRIGLVQDVCGHYGILFGFGKRKMPIGRKNSHSRVRLFRNPSVEQGGSPGEVDITRDQYRVK